MEIVSSAQLLEALSKGERYFENAKLDGEDFSEKSFKDCVFRDCAFIRCNFIGASFRRADLRGCYLAYSSFINADMRYCKLDGAVLHRANFENASCEGASFKSALITQNYMRYAKDADLTEVINVHRNPKSKKPFNKDDRS